MLNQFVCRQHITTQNSSPDAKIVLINKYQHTISIAEMGAILVVAPHPDDETLGCGGLIAMCARVQQPVFILAMTNGEASHPGDQAWRRKLGQIRQQEQLNALRVLGIRNPNVISLALADGGVNQLNGEHRTEVSAFIKAGMKARSIETLFVPAIDDCHGDHQATARLLADIVLNCPVKYVFGYQIWPPAMRPAQVSSNEMAYTLDISNVLALKIQAIQEHRSQLGAVEPAHTEGFCMPQVLLDEKLKAHESYALIHNIAAWSG